MLKRWITPTLNDETKTKIATLSKAANIADITAQILWQRGITTPEAAAAFLRPETLQPWHDPFLMKDMVQCVERIETAIKDGEHITVYGDYDVDGITATTLLVKNLRLLGGDADYYIPDRQKEGYGFNRNSLNRIAERGGLLVSVDCGISSVEDVAAMAGKLDIIITDHHSPGKVLPPALAVVNPHREDCSYPDKNLAGVGVAFKVCQALWQKIRGEEFAGDLDVVSLGTVADIVPLLGENRKIVKLGLQKLSVNDKLDVGLRALIDVAGLSDKELNAGHIGFGLAPRLNAAGRMGSGADGVKLLLTTDRTEAEAIARKLNEENATRQNIEKEILQKAEEKLAASGREHSAVIDGYEWHAGVIGIVASRLVDRHYLPTIVISRQGDKSKGSCRSIKGLNMYEALCALSEYLLIFGGHEMAAGFSIKEGNIAAFARAFDEYAAKHLTDEDYVPAVNVAAEIAPHELSAEIVEELSQLEPFGMGNPKPLFGCRNAQGSEPKVIGKQSNHLTFKLKKDGGETKMLLWNCAELAGIVGRELLDVVYSPQINEWQGQKNVEATIEAIAPAAVGQTIPDREILATVYRFLKKNANAPGGLPVNAAALTVKFCESGNSITLYTMEIALKIFEELRLIIPNVANKRYTLPIVGGKMQLSDSKTYRKYCTTA